MRGAESRFFLWPIMHQERFDRGNEVVRRLYVLPFYYSDIHRERMSGTVTAKPDDPVPRGRITNNYQKVWPLFSYLREGDEMRFRMLALWPSKNMAPVERNYAPFWTLLQNVRFQDKSQTEVLWGMFRREREGEDHVYTSVFPLMNWERDTRESVDRFRWSILKGLIGYEREDTTSRYRLLYLLRWESSKEMSS